jgi:thymidylate synthase (FAD)
MGVAREQARKDLPLSNYTEAYWKVDLHNLFHFLRLRMDAHAQQEIREFAEIAGREIIAKMFPHAWEAFVDYRLEAIQLSRLEIGVVKRMLIESRVNRTSTFRKNFEKCQDPSWKRLKNCRERDECLEKLEILGVFPNGSAKS